MTDTVGQGTLKLVSGWSPSRSVDQTIGRILTDSAGPNDVRRLSDGVYLVFTAEEPEDVRNEIAAQLTEGDSVFVVEFERWSSQGPAADRTWLLRRGH